MAKIKLSAEDVSDVVSVLSSHIKSPPCSVSGDLIRELSTETTPKRLQDLYSVCYQQETKRGRKLYKAACYNAIYQ